MVNIIFNKDVKRGEIYWVNFGNGVGSEQCNIRPAVIVSNDKNNKYSPTVQVLPITSARKTNIPVHVIVGKKEGLSQLSTVLTEQERTVDKSRLGDKIGNCDKDIMLKIDKAIIIQKGIDVYSLLKVANQ